MISGSDGEKDNVVIIELKGWERAKKLNDISMHSVETYVGGSQKVVSHPSYQAYSYSVLLKNISAVVQDYDIELRPCAYLHNYDSRFSQELSDSIYKTWYNQAPFFIKDQMGDMASFISKYIRKTSKNKDLLFTIDQGELRPSKALQDAIASTLKGKPEFTLIDEQAVIFDICIKAMADCLADGKKRTIIIEGGPGTGKSVLAINLLQDFISKRLFASYVTRNAAPRNAFEAILTDNAMSRLQIKALFRSPFRLSEARPNSFKCLITDEAHRLVKKMYGDYRGQNQVKEIIDASLLSIFLIDEKQRITSKDIGSVEEIRKWADVLGSSVIHGEETLLKSQFRCNGSDGFIQIVDNMLQIGERVDITNIDINYEIRIFDNPSDMRDALRIKNQINNKARMVAGYCYDWNVKNGRGEWDIVIGDFKAKWNLPEDKIWAVSPSSFEQVGCIHTSQGLEFDYVGVIIGKDLVYDPIINKVITNKKAVSNDDFSSGIKASPDDIADALIRNTYKTLMTRAQKGCYLFCESNELNNYFKIIMQ